MSKHARPTTGYVSARKRINGNSLDVEVCLVDVTFELSVTGRAKDSTKWCTMPQREVRLMPTIIGTVAEKANVLDANSTFRPCNGIRDEGVRAAE